MKKILGLLICLLMIPMIANADMGGPVIKEYDAIIINPNGVKTTDGKIIPYETKILVNGEVSDDFNVIYVTFEYDGDYHRAPLTDIRPLQDIVKPTNDEKIDSKTLPKLYVYAEEGVKIYNGPSQAYKAVDIIIPTGTILEYEYATDEFLWVYVTYKEKSGWILVSNSIYNGDAGVAKHVTFNVLTAAEKKLLDKPGEKGKTIGTVPAETKLIVTDYNDIGYEGYTSGGYYYVSYNNQKGWVENNCDIAREHKYVGIANGNSGIAVTKFDSEVLNILYEANELDYLNKLPKIFTIPNKAKFQIEYSVELFSVHNWYYVTYNEQSGWMFNGELGNEHEIIFNGFDYEEGPKYSNNASNSTNEDPTNNASNSTNEDPIQSIIEEPKAKKAEVVAEKGPSELEIAVVCISGALAIGLTAFAVIKLLNKKNQKKAVDAVVNNNIEPDIKTEENNDEVNK